jgi:serine/threonine protein kinase
MSLRPGETVAITKGGAPPALHRVMRVLARGAHTEVCLAVWEQGASVLKTGLAAAARRDVDLAIEERIVAQLDHENVVRFLGRGEHPTAGPVLAYERVHEDPLLTITALRARLPNDPGTRYYPLPPSVSLRLARDLLRGLEHMHRRSFVHHDVKLANLMVRVPDKGADASDAVVLDAVLAGGGQGVLVDFGATRSAAYLAELNRGEASHDLTPPQLTPLYAPPEALDAARPRFDPSIDVYAAALVLYSCASGRAPYDHLGGGGDEAQGLARLRRLKAGERKGELMAVSFDALAGAPGLRSLAGDVHGFVAACLATDPEARPSVTEARRHVERLNDLVGAPRGKRLDDRGARDGGVFFGRKGPQRPGR